MAQPWNAGILVPGIAVKHLLMHLRKYRVSNRAQLIQLAVTQKWALLFANYCLNLSLHKRLNVAYSARMIFFFSQSCETLIFHQWNPLRLDQCWWDVQRQKPHCSKCQPGKSCYHLMHVIGTRQQLFAKLLWSSAWVFPSLQNSVKLNYFWEVTWFFVFFSRSGWDVPL